MCWDGWSDKTVFLIIFSLYITKQNDDEQYYEQLHHDPTHDLFTPYNYCHFCTVTPDNTGYKHNTHDTHDDDTSYSTHDDTSKEDQKEENYCCYIY